MIPPPTSILPKSAAPPQTIPPPRYRGGGSPSTAAESFLAPPPPSAAKPTPNDAIAGVLLLSVVSEKTGYPVDSLDLSLSLDADLGVDSIKRVEILSAIRGEAARRPGSQARAPRHTPQLKDVADFLAGPTGSNQINAGQGRHEDRCSAPRPWATSSFNYLPNG